MSFRAATTKLLAGTIALLALAPARGRAQPCRQDSSRTTLATLSGRPIRSLSVVTHEVEVGSGAIGAMAATLHVRTRPATVERQLLFAAGDTIDTLRVAESLRRLRQRRYLADAEVVGTRCDGADGVDLEVRTRDAWSTRPELSMKSSAGGGTAGTTNQSAGPSSTIGLEERNLLGTGRGAKLYLRSFGSRLGTGLLIDDPWFLGSRYSAQVGVDSYRDGSDARMRLTRREETLFDPWGVSLEVARGVRRVPGADTLRRDAASLLFARRLGGRGENDDRVTSLLLGAEGEVTHLVAAPEAALVGPGFAARRMAALDLGLRRRTAQYDTLTWLLPGAPIVDVPMGMEGEVVAGGGWDMASDAPALHLDGWVGRAWLPRPGAMLTADAWSAGYLIGGSWRAGNVRGALGYSQAASRGTWTARLSAERLYAPDPDVRALMSDDPTASVIADRQRLSQAAVSAGLERTLRLRRLTRSWALDGAAFAAGSLREDAAGPGPEMMGVGVLGVGLRGTPTRAGRGTFRLDVGYPVVSSGMVARRLYVGFSVAPWMGDTRHRGSQDR